MDIWRRRQMDIGMKVAGLGVDLRITAILRELGIVDLSRLREIPPIARGNVHFPPDRRPPDHEA